ncbi:MAG TPA: HU family DNA-binding protein [Nannocystaceae bacterium]|nr:HU family DNA-binding protein [Nannocystaceae bacterium]
MTKAELIEKIVKSRDLPPDVTKKCVQQIIDIAFDELGTYFVRAKVTKNQSPRFTFPGFGTFSKKKRSARKGVNPRTLEPMVIDACYTIDFRPGVELRRALNGEIVARGRDERPTLGLVHAPADLDADEDDDEVELDAPRRRLRSRDEVELEEVDAEVDPTLFGGDYDLPAPPMQRVRAPSTSRRDTGSGGS